jgi:hypothetical protein
MRRDLSEQHELLTSLEQKYPDTVLYASPCIRSLKGFDRAYNGSRVHERSIFFSPLDIGPLPDDEQHSVAYKRRPPTAYFCSDPVQAMNYNALVRRIRSRFETGQVSGPSERLA